MPKAVFLSAACLAGAALLVISGAARGISDQVRKLHFSSIVVDTHDDTTQRLLDPDFDLGIRQKEGSIDIPRMREGGLGAIFFSLWVPSKITGPEAVRRAREQIEAVLSQVKKHPKDLVLATSVAQIRQASTEGRIAVLMGLEGGHMINSELGNLGEFASLGVRYMTLTHSGNVEWADSSTDKPVHKGLSAFGKQVVREMNRLGMMVDISHVSDKTFYDALEVSQAPLVATHSSCRALCDAARNLTDQMMIDLAARGGVVQINYHVGFLSQEFRDAEKANPQLEKGIQAEISKRCGNNEACQLIEGDRIVREYMLSGKLPRVSYGKIIEHLDHAMKLIGAEHVGLGSDFDGAMMPFGMEDVSKLPAITESLLAKGYSAGDIKNVLGENTLRVMKEVERVSRAWKPRP